MKEFTSIMLPFMIVVMFSLQLKGANEPSPVIKPVNMFISLEQEDLNLICTKNLADAIKQNLVSICTTDLLCQLKHQNLQFATFFCENSSAIDYNSKLIAAYKNILDKNVWQCYMDDEHNIAVLIPRSLHSTPKQLGLDKCAINLMQPDTLDGIIEKLSIHTPHQCNFSIFKNLFQKSSHITFIPKRIYAIGHGKEKLSNDTHSTIASMRISECADFLSFLGNIDTQILYLVSCYSSGKNALKLMNQASLDSVRYPIIFQSTAGTETSTPLNSPTPLLSTLKALGKYAKSRNHFDRQPWRLKTALNIIFTSCPEACNIPSIRMPYGPFRTLEINDTYIINDCILGHYKTMGQKINHKIPQHTKFILLCASNLLNSSIELTGPTCPQILSKIPGNSSHIIGSIYAPDVNFETFITQGFIYFRPSCSIISEGSGVTKQAWFIERLITQNEIYHGLIIYKSGSEKAKGFLVMYESDHHHYIGTIPPTDYLVCPDKSSCLFRFDVNAQLSSSSEISADEYYMLAASIHEHTAATDQSLMHASPFTQNMDSTQQAFNQFIANRKLQISDLYNHATITAAKKVILNETDNYVVQHLATCYLKQVHHHLEPQSTCTLASELIEYNYPDQISIGLQLLAHTNIMPPISEHLETTLKKQAFYVLTEGYPQHHKSLLKFLNDGKKIDMINHLVQEYIRYIAFKAETEYRPRIYDDVGTMVCKLSNMLEKFGEIHRSQLIKKSLMLSPYKSLRFIAFFLLLEDALKYQRNDYFLHQMDILLKEIINDSESPSFFSYRYLIKISQFISSQQLNKQTKEVLVELIYPLLESYSFFIKRISFYLGCILYKNYPESSYLMQKLLETAYTLITHKIFSSEPTRFVDYPLKAFALDLIQHGQSKATKELAQKVLCYQGPDRQEVLHVANPLFDALIEADLLPDDMIQQFF